MAQETMSLLDLAAEDVPEELKAESYFDFDAHPFEHRALFDETTSVCGAIRGINDYATNWLAEAIDRLERAGEAEIFGGEELDASVRGAVKVLLGEGAVFEPRSIVGTEGGDPGRIAVAAGARVIGCDLNVEKQDIFVGSGTQMEAGVGVKGPTIIGKDCEIRQGAYLRGDCILGNGCTIRAEMKNAVVMDKGNFPHPSYLGDSIAGYMTHFGNQVTAANLGIYNGLREKEDRINLTLTIGAKTYDIATPKMGVVLGDFSQVGCSSTTDPGTFLRPYTIAYTLTRITKGFYGPREVLKNKPLEHGVVERVPMRPL